MNLKYKTLLFAAIQKDRTFKRPLSNNFSKPAAALTIDSILPYLLSLFLLTGGMIGFSARCIISIKIKTTYWVTFHQDFAISF